ncbi:MAG: TIM barrel protein [Chitinophagaceae bacterium]
MSITRRKFITQGSMSLAASAFYLNNVPVFKEKVFLGLQLYTVRDEMKRDPAATLKAVADMGYRYVEHANYVNRKMYGMPVPEFKKLLDGLGLKMYSGHTVMALNHWDATKKDFTDAWKYTVEDAATAGQKFVISPSLDGRLRKNAGEFKAFMDVFNKSGELCNKSGMKFGYHNHDFEFSQMLEGETLYDLILKLTDPKLVAQQLDIGNMKNGGGDAMTILKKYPGRFELLHVKDEIPASAGTEKYESTVLGQGIIGTRAVTDTARKQGSKYFIVEQESYLNSTPMADSKKDFDIMKKWGY